MNRSFHNVAVCLMAAFQPEATKAEMRSNAKTSSSLRAAIARMDNEASDLKEVATMRRPFQTTLRDIVESIL